VSLEIVQSHDRETAGFIRSALPNTLPRLESLDIELRRGAFPEHERAGSIPNDVLSYMDDIARLAPNIVELGLRGIHFEPESLVRVISNPAHIIPIPDPPSFPSHSPRSDLPCRAL
jgi:hypothetical protein